MTMIPPAPETTEDKEIQIISAGWTTFAKHCDFFKGNPGICLKILQVYNSSVLLAKNCGAETLAFTSQATTKLAAAEKNWIKVCYI